MPLPVRPIRYDVPLHVLSTRYDVPFHVPSCQHDKPIPASPLRQACHCLTLTTDRTYSLLFVPARQPCPSPPFSHQYDRSSLRYPTLALTTFQSLSSPPVMTYPVTPVRPRQHDKPIYACSRRFDMSARDHPNQLDMPNLHYSRRFDMPHQTSPIRHAEPFPADSDTTY